MNFSKLNIFLVLVIIGILLYFHLCSDKDNITKEEGIVLAQKTELALHKLDSLFTYLDLKIDSSKIINNYYTKNYVTEKSRIDSILEANPEYADSIFLSLVKKLRSEPSPLE